MPQAAAHRAKFLASSCFVLLALASSAIAQDVERRFAGFAVYGTDRLDASALRDGFAVEVERVMAAEMPFDNAAIEPMMQAIHESIAARGDWALLNLGIESAFVDGVMMQMITIEAVEEADRARRMPFRAAPDGSYQDPGGVFAAWDEYFEVYFDLFASGELRNYDNLACPVLHCFASFDAPALAPYLELFNAAAREHGDLLYDIVANDADSQHRRHALATLAHTNDAERLLPSLANAIYDPSGEVRNDAMRIMLFMARANPDRAYPVTDLIRAMDFPGGAQRNKAVSVLEQLVAVPRHAAIVRADGLPNLLKLLRTPGELQHGPAYAILKTLSGQDFGPRDYAAWDAWVDEYR